MRGCHRVSAALPQQMRGLSPEKLATHIYETSSLEIELGANTTWKKEEPSDLFQLRVLPASRHQNRNIRIPILPKRKKIRISRPSLSRIPSKRITPRNTQMRQRPKRKIQGNSAMIRKLLKLRRRPYTIPLHQKG